MSGGAAPSRNPNVSRRVPDPARFVRAAKASSPIPWKIVPQRDRARIKWHWHPAGVFARRWAGSHHLGLHAALMVLTSTSRAERSRIVVMTVVAVIIAVALIAVLLSFDSIGEMFKTGARASIKAMTKAASAGSGGIILGADMALDLPFGIGPLQFHNYFPRTPTILSERLHVRRLDLRRLLSRIGVVTVIIGFRHVFVPRALATRLSRGVRGLPGNGRAKASSSTPTIGGTSG